MRLVDNTNFGLEELSIAPFNFGNRGDELNLATESNMATFYLSQNIQFKSKLIRKSQLLIWLNLPGIFF